MWMQLWLTKYNITLKCHLIYDTFLLWLCIDIQEKTTSTTASNMWGPRNFLTLERDSDALNQPNCSHLRVEIQLNRNIIFMQQKIIKNLNLFLSKIHFNIILKLIPTDPRIILSPTSIIYTLLFSP
jgi:hypothetical protein